MLKKCFWGQTESLMGMYLGPKKIGFRLPQGGCIGGPCITPSIMLLKSLYVPLSQPEFSLESNAKCVNISTFRDHSHIT